MNARYSIRALVLAWLSLYAASPSAAQAAPRCVVDDSGQTLCLPAPARRIVSLSPHLTELVFAAGAGASLVGAAEHSDYPEAARHIARIGRSDRLDLERILVLKPDLVLAWTGGNPARQIRQLEELGLLVLHDNPRKLPDVARSLRRLGLLSGTEQIADAGALRYEQTLQGLRQQTAGAARLSVFYQVWDRPLYTVSGSHWISDVIDLCGGSNIFVQLSELAPTVSLEAVLAADPDVILVSGGVVCSALPGSRPGNAGRSCAPCAMNSFTPSTPISCSALLRACWKARVTSARRWSILVRAQLELILQTRRIRDRGNIRDDRRKCYESTVRSCCCLAHHRRAAAAAHVRMHHCEICQARQDPARSRVGVGIRGGFRVRAGAVHHAQIDLRGEVLTGSVDRLAVDGCVQVKAQSVQWSGPQ
jgi:iron complex transport system substrate-binding protein